MAGAVVPLITSLAPTVLELITSLVHQFAPKAELAYGPKTGPVKFADVLGDVLIKIQAAAAAGQIPKDLPSEDTIKFVIQTVVTSMKLLGALDKAALPDLSSAALTPAPGTSAPTVNPPGAQTIRIAPGQQLTIVAA
jgi:hypothetical protein